MRTITPEIFNITTEGKPCREFIHPWSPTCTQGIVEMVLSAIKGSGKFSLALHTLQLLSKGKNLTKQHVKYVAESAIRMTLLGPGIGLIFVGISCLQIKLCGGYVYQICMSVPGFFSGAAIFLMQKAKRHYVISAFSSGALETFLTCYTPLNAGRQCYLKTQTFFFMVVNGAFLYLMKLWKTNKADKILPEIWFYSPSAEISAKKTTEDRRKSISYHPCNHLNSCFRSILKETSNYFWFGTILEVLRITVSNFRTMIRNPRTIIKFIFKKSTLKLAAFASLYVFLYKVTNCLQCRLSGKDDATNALVSGFVSGLSYYIHPNLSLALTAFTNLIHISWKYFNVNRYFGEFSTSEVTFMFVVGFLFHYRMRVPDRCSRFFINIISLATSGRSDEMFEAFLNSIPTTMIS
ncbi:transmembrane protein 135 homolog [Planococcus citri]|uniref:transmembrane protein 135 homolog n=1 Tax=Planococcus citri TaxID=170843 RepID=UPI0031F8D045